MKIVCVTGSRADWNGIDVVAHALIAAGFDVSVAYTGQWCEVGVAPSAPGGCWGWINLDRRGDEPFDIAGAAARAVLLFAQSFVPVAPDLVVLAGDRWEIAAVAVACSLMRVPIAHIGGGDRTLGSADDRYRDAITALATLHFATNRPAFERLCAMVPFDRSPNVTQSGDPEIDRICSTPIVSRETWRERWEVPGDNQINPLVIFHPVTGSSDPALGLDHIINSVETMPGDDVRAIVFGTNADAGSEAISDRLQAFARDAGHHFVRNLDPADFYACLTYGDMLIGNSSAGLIEAPLFGIPVVNVRPRQDGRIAARNVITVDPTEDDISWGIMAAMQPRRLKIESPYGDGKAAGRIVDAIMTWAGLRKPSSAVLASEVDPTAGAEPSFRWDGDG